jgi:predicted CoA-binding protein
VRLPHQLHLVQKICLGHNAQHPTKAVDDGHRVNVPAVIRSTISRYGVSAATFAKRIAVTGVSRTPQGHGSNIVYQRLRDRGYQVFAINPNADEVDGDTCYQDLKSVPGGVDAVVIGTRPEIAEAAVRECADLGISYVWMHRSFGAGSVSEAATEYGRRHGITVIDGGCPLMFDPTADLGHKAMRFVCDLDRPRGRCFAAGWFSARSCA